MVTINKPIEMIVQFDATGIPTPKKFKLYNEDGQAAIINIDKIVQIDRARSKSPEKQNFYIYQCKSEVEDTLFEFEIKYEFENTTWYLYRM